MKTRLTAKRLLAVTALVAGVGLFGPARPVDLAAVGPVTISTPMTFAAVNVGDDSPGDPTIFTVNGDLTITSNGAITCNDPSSPGNDSACDIEIVVTGNLLMQAGAEINADNTTGGGRGGNITITVGGNMTMCGQTGSQTGCLAPPTGKPGALIAARNLSTTNNSAGDINITVGDTAKATGRFYMEGGSTAYGKETGATIDATSSVESGDISIRPGGSYFTEPGSVVASGGYGGTATQQGGKIYIVSGCRLTTEGRITSKGPDFGADLIHLDGCEVIVRGLVESTGKGHAADSPNSCDNVDDGLAGEVFRLGKPANSTGCIEVWSKVVTIDATNGWAGELNADIGNGGAGGTSWIDILALSKLTVTDGTGNDRESDNLGHPYFSTYAVHANAIDGSDNTPGVVTALVKSGPLTASGKAFEASSTLTDATGHGTVDPFVGNGSDGGTIDVEASGAVTLDNAFLNAAGDFDGGSPCPSGSGECGSGGHIIVKAWGAGSNVSWQSGSGDVRTNDSGGSVIGGDITLNACGGTINTNLTDFHGELPSISADCDASKPTIPVYNTAANGTGAPVVVFNQTVWDLCSASTISGRKYDSVSNVGLNGWVIHLFGKDVNGTAVHQTQTTAGGGFYTFTGVAPGTYTVCEQLQTGWTQSFPTSGADCDGPPNPDGDNLTPGALGYTVDLTNGACCGGTTVTGKDFGNTTGGGGGSTCPEDPNRALLLTRIVDLSKPNLSGAGVAGDPKNYLKVQAAYDAAKASGQAEVIGLFANTSENLTLDGAKSLTITQCTVARVTGAAGSPVWNITSTGKLTIIGPDAVGGSIGWRVAGNGGHTLKSVRANSASVDGILITSNSNSVSWNAVSGNGNGTATAAGIRVEGSSNTLKGGTVESNSGDGVQLTGGSNNLSGATIQSNSGNGVLVSGSTNTVKSNSLFQNSKNGILVSGSTNVVSSNSSDSGKGNTMNGIQVSAGSGNTLSDNKMNSNGLAGFNLAANTGTKVKSNANTNNTGNEFTIGANNVDQGGNKKNGTGFTFAAAGGNFN